MHRFPVASAHGAPVDTLLARCLEALPTPAAPAPLGLIYANEALAAELPAILRRLCAATPDTHWCGALGPGVIAGGCEYYEEPALSLMLCPLPREQLAPLPQLLPGQEGGLSALRRWHARQPGGMALVHGDARDAQTPALLEALAAELPQVVINGALAGAQAQQPLISGGPRDGGIGGALFRADAALLYDLSQGCARIGPIHEITRARHNLAIELDGRPALEVMLEDIGEVLARDLRRIAGYIFAGLPIDDEGGGKRDGDYLVRNLMGIDQQQQVLAVGESLQRHRRLMFCRRDGNSAREDLHAMCLRLRQRLAGRSIRGGVYISCIGRGRHQFGPNSAELSIIRATLGDFPLTGLFANGEIYRGRLYAYTGTLTLFC